MSSNIGKKLDEWLMRQKPKDFPGNGKTGYVKQFDNVTDFMRKHVHTEVEKGAAVHDEERGMFLNNHGTEHIDSVILRASEILNAAECEITPYEAYLFLFAVHLHDTGNVYGRDKHEQTCRSILNQLGTRAGDDDLEKSWITRIAMAHGGKTPEGNKDTINSLIPNPEIQLLGQTVRVQFLAALLRLADEIADDRTRASRFMVQAEAVPDKSKLYHQYSQCLHSVAVGEREITLDFDLREDTAKLQFDKNGNPAFLLDEIFLRTLKMHLERMYCMRFLRPKIQLDEVRVTIQVFDVKYIRVLEEIKYQLSESGYPGHPAEGICALCPTLKTWSGQILKDKLNQIAEVVPCQQ